MSTIQISLTGNLTADPELRFTPSGQAVASLTIAVTHRTRKADGTWEDGETTFLRGAAWGSLAAHIADSLSRGDRVNATGTLKARAYEKDGENRTVFEATYDTVSPDLRFATAKPQKTTRSQGSDQATDDYQTAVRNLRDAGVTAPAPF